MAQNMHNDIDIDFDGIIQKMHDGALKGMEIVAADWDKEAINTFSKHTGTNDVRNSIKVSVKIENEKIGAHFIANHPAAATLHFGRGKNKRIPPITIIQKWARRKLTLSQEESEKAAFGIAKSIGKKGFFTSKKKAGSKYATEKGPGGTYGLRFASGPLESKGKSGGKWEEKISKELLKVK